MSEPPSRLLMVPAKEGTQDDHGANATMKRRGMEYGAVHLRARAAPTPQMVTSLDSRLRGNDVLLSASGQR